MDKKLKILLGKKKRKKKKKNYARFTTSLASSHN